MRAALELLISVPSNDGSGLQASLPGFLGGIGIRIATSLAIPAVLDLTLTSTTDLASFLLADFPAIPDLKGASALAAKKSPHLPNSVSETFQSLLYNRQLLWKLQQPRNPMLESWRPRERNMGSG